MKPWSNYKTIGLSAIAFWLFVSIMIIIGWIMNIMDLFAMEAILNGEGAIRIIGIFVFPIGTIMGWFF